MSSTHSRLLDFAKWVVAQDEANMHWATLTGVPYTIPSYVVDALNVIHDAPRDEAELTRIMQRYFP